MHASRVLRFDGLKALSAGGYSLYDKYWGVSEIVPAINAIINDATVAQGAVHLAQEASIPILRVDGLRDAHGIGGRPLPPTNKRRIR